MEKPCFAEIRQRKGFLHARLARWLERKQRERLALFIECGRAAITRSDEKASRGSSMRLADRGVGPFGRER